MQPGLSIRVGSQSSLKLPEESDHRRREHQVEQLAASPSVSMLPGERATVQRDKFSRFADEFLERPTPGLVAEVVVQTHVDAAGAEGSVQVWGVSVDADEWEQVCEIVSEAVGGDCGVFPTGPGLHPVDASGKTDRHRPPGRARGKPAPVGR